MKNEDDMLSHTMKPNSSDTRTELLRVALKCFATHGFDGTSMRTIAGEAKRPISIISHHFENKEGFYLAVFEWILADILPGPGMRTTPESSVAPHDPTEAILILREQVHHMYLEASQDPRLGDPLYKDASRLLLQEIREPRPSLHPLLLKYFQPRVKLIGRCITMLRPELDGSLTAFLATSVVGAVIGHGVMHGLSQIVWELPKAACNPFQEAELLVDLCLHGLTGLRR